MDFDIASSTFKLSVIVGPDDNCDKPTEVYIPFVHYAASLTSASISRSSLLDQKVDQEDPNAELRLAIDVELSTGRYEVSGQTLSWYYDPPAVERTYTLQVTRTGGALRRPVGAMQEGSWGEVCPTCVIA